MPNAINVKLMVLGRLSEAKLTAKPAKCEWGKRYEEVRQLLGTQGWRRARQHTRCESGLHQGLCATEDEAAAEVVPWPGRLLQEVHPVVLSCVCYYPMLLFLPSLHSRTFC